MAELRIQEAKTLLDNGQWAGAYYLAGYAVECALKACIAKQTSQYDFPDKDRAIKAFTHSLESLISTAGLANNLRDESNSNRMFRLNWEVVKDRKEIDRYRHNISEQAARDLYTAITDPKDGVQAWLMKFW